MRLSVVYGLLLIALCGCDLSRHISDVPNNIGDFIATRYPALLADPNSEIYEYASVLDYGKGNNAHLYGMPKSEAPSKDDYILYAPSSDYIHPDQRTMTKQTISDVETDYGTLVIAEKKSLVVNTSTISVEKGDTVYSIAKRHNMAVQRLVVLNNLEEPYQLSIGQSLKVETAEIVTTKTEITKTDGTAGEAKEIRQTPVVKSNPAIRLPNLPPRSGNKFAWPVKGRIVSDFGPTPDGLVNDGINIGAGQGTVVGAAENGVVMYVGNEVKGMGNLVIMQHAGGWMTVYAHLDEIIAKRGDKVAVGQKIGTVGTTGRVSTPQLHFEVRKGSKAHDPKRELR